MYGKECPTCHAWYSDETAVCPKDGAKLEASLELHTGEIFAGQFTILEVIGEGSVGTVYRARQESVGREVAVKVLKRRYQKHETISKRFENEAKVISQLRHPNTVKLIDYRRTSDDHLFIVTELLRGMSLRQLLDDGALPVDRAINVAIQICGSLGEAHAAGIVHRDLKPENVFLDRVAGEDHVKVLDFGIAKMMAHESLQTNANVVIGTPAYMSPEQSQSEPPDQRSDVYALGVLLHEMIVGKPPFCADTSVGVMVQHIQETPKPLSSLVEPSVLIPADLEALILQMLEKDRTRRPEKMEEVRARLQRIVSGMQSRLPTTPMLRVVSATSENPTEELPLPPPPGDEVSQPTILPPPRAFFEQSLPPQPEKVREPLPRRPTSSISLALRDRLPIGRIALAFAFFAIAAVVLIRYVPLAGGSDVVLASKTDVPAKGESADITLTSDPDRADVFAPGGGWLGATPLHLSSVEDGLYLLQGGDGRRGTVRLDPSADRGKRILVVLTEPAKAAEVMQLDHEPEPPKPLVPMQSMKAAPKKTVTRAVRSTPLEPARAIEDNPLPVKFE